MAEFLLSSIMIRTARNGSKYITGKLKNKKCPWEEEFDFHSFSQEMVKILAPYLSKTKGGIAEEDKNIPIELRTITGCWIYHPHPFHEQFFEKYTKNIPTKNIHKGDYIRNEDGCVAVFKALRIFCQYYIDEFGEKVWIKGESPYEVFMQDFKYRCVPYSTTLEAELNQDKQKYAINETTSYDEDIDNINYYEYEEDDNDSSLHYDDGLDMDQQSEDYWKELGIF